MTASQVKNNGVLLSHLDTQKRELIILRGITTSQINSGNKASKTNGQYPYPARVFLKVVDKEGDIPIFFRIKDQDNNWIRPQIKTGSCLQVEGYFSIGTVYIKQSERKSFTATSYQILEEDYLAKKEILNQAKNQLPEFEQALTNIQQIRQQLESHDRRLYTFKK